MPRVKCGIILESPEAPPAFRGGAQRFGLISGTGDGAGSVDGDGSLDAALEHMTSREPLPERESRNPRPLCQRQEARVSEREREN